MNVNIDMDQYNIGPPQARPTSQSDGILSISSYVLCNCDEATVTFLTMSPLKFTINFYNAMQSFLIKKRRSVDRDECDRVSPLSD